MSRTPNIGLPLRTAGHVPTQNSLKEGFEIVDSLFANLDQRLTALENSTPDSNGGSMQWSMTFPGLTDPVAQTLEPGDTITVGDVTYSFVAFGNLTAPNQFVGGSFNVDSNNVFEFDDAINTLVIFLATGTAVGEGVNMSEGTVLPSNATLTFESAQAFAMAISGDPNQNTPWPALVFEGPGAFGMSYESATCPIQLTPA